MSRPAMAFETHGPHDDVQPALLLSVAGLLSLVLVTVSILAVPVSLGLSIMGAYLAQRAIGDDASIPFGGYTNVVVARLARGVAWVAIVGSTLVLLLFLWNFLLPALGVGPNA